MKRKTIHRILKEESGTALVIALIMIVVLTLIGLSSTSTSIFETILSGLKRESTNAYYAADAGAQVVFNDPTNTNFNKANYVAVATTVGLPSDLVKQPIDQKLDKTSPTPLVLTIPGGGLDQPKPDVTIFHLRRDGGEGLGYTWDAYVVASTGKDQVSADVKKSEVTLRQKWMLRSVSQSE